MKKVICILLVSSALAGCNINLQGHNYAPTVSGLKYLSGPSTSRAGLSESLVNCLTDAIDPMNRGSKCN